MKALVALAAVLALLGGCASKKPVPTLEEQYSEAFYELPPATSGGLFRPGFTGSLVSDKRAVRAGDILTVVLNESTQSSKSAGTSIDKNSGMSLEVPVFFGEAVPDASTEFSAGRDFKGAASSSQQNKLLGAIAVTVQQVLPNGTLLVKGRKQLQLNQGDEFIELTGLVRAEDISSGNQISSQNVANARITYAGSGALNDSNRSGWLSRFFASPYFPI